jgi:hypothetical protein
MFSFKIFTSEIEHKQQGFGNKILMKMFRPKKDELLMSHHPDDGGSKHF